MKKNLLFIILLVGCVFVVGAQDKMLVFTKGKHKYIIRKNWGELTIIGKDKEKVKGVVDSFNLEMINLKTATGSVRVEIKNIRAFKRRVYFWCIGTMCFIKHWSKIKIEGYKWKITD